MVDLLRAYNETMGMHNAQILTTIGGAALVTYTVVIAWGRMVEDFGPIGGMMCAGIIVGTFWIMNHKLPGFGINPNLIPDEAGNPKQFGLIAQAFHYAGPWIDMGWAIGMGLWVCGYGDFERGKKAAVVKESLPRLGAVILGGLIGGAIVGLTGFTTSTFSIPTP